ERRNKVSHSGSGVREHGLDAVPVIRRAAYGKRPVLGYIAFDRRNGIVMSHVVLRQCPAPPLYVAGHRGERAVQCLLQVETGSINQVGIGELKLTRLAETPQ